MEGKEDFHSSTDLRANFDIFILKKAIHFIHSKNIYQSVDSLLGFLVAQMIKNPSAVVETWD